jgi:hypothetical protein
MNTVSTTPGAAVDWRRQHALGWPSGSVRAALAILIFATTWGLLVLRPALEAPDYLRDLLFIIMGHYFATRRRVDSAESPGPPPLYLPRGSVRLVLLVGCAAVAGLLFHRGELTRPEQNPGVLTLLLIGGFLLGVVLSAITSWWRECGHTPPRAIEDFKAIITIIAALVLTGLIWNRLFPVYPPAQIDATFARWLHLGRFRPENALAAVVGFYFGSRS